MLLLCFFLSFFLSGLCCDEHPIGNKIEANLYKTHKTLITRNIITADILHSTYNNNTKYTQRMKEEQKKKHTQFTRVLFFFLFRFCCRCFLFYFASILYVVYLLNRRLSVFFLCFFFLNFLFFSSEVFVFIFHFANYIDETHNLKRRQVTLQSIDRMCYFYSVFRLLFFFFNFSIASLRFVATIIPLALFQF